MFLFKEEGAKNFIREFKERHTRMQEYFSDIEEEANKLDNMKRGASISTVVGSSVGVVGGVLSIVGLALAPVTAGISLTLTMTGLGMGLASGANGLVTGITQIAVNCHRKKNSTNTFMKLMEEMTGLGDILEKVGKCEMPPLESRELSSPGIQLVVEALRAGVRASGIGKGIDSLVDCASAARAPNLAADLPDIGQVAKGTPLALSKAARSGFIALNALFIGLDIFFICNESISLAKKKKNEWAQLIRSRVDLWRSEMESWKMIHDSLAKEIENFRENQSILNRHFIPNTE